jgi:hypothetical protein
MLLARKINIGMFHFVAVHLLQQVLPERVVQPQQPKLQTALHQLTGAQLIIIGTIQLVAVDQMNHTLSEEVNVTHQRMGAKKVISGIMIHALVNTIPT